eukprot:gene816-1021_t
MPMEIHTEQPSYETIWNKAITSSRPNLRELINFDWTQSEQSVNNFIDFVTNLVTYKSTYAQESFNILIQAFEPYRGMIKSGAAGGPIPYDKWEMISMKVHFSLNKILSVIPLSSTVLANLIVDKFPHKSHSADIQHFYLKNALFVTRYCPTITNTILSSAISMLIQIDASISIDAIPDEDDLQFHDNDVQEDQENAQKLDILMNLVLDYLNARFGLAKKESGNPFYFIGCEEQDQQTQDDLFSNLIKIFDTTILTTYKSKYTQYLLFYVSKLHHKNTFFQPLNTNSTLILNTTATATGSPLSPSSSSPSIFITPSFNKQQQQQQYLSVSPSKKLMSASPKKSKTFLHIDPISINSNKVLYAESFIRFLFSKLSNEKVHSMYRHACAAYIGGFISRASFLPNHLIKLAFRELLNFAIAYVDRVDHKNNPNCSPDPQVHSLFYSVCQSVYYIFCFRNKIILDFSKDFKNDKKNDKQREFWQDLNEAFRKISVSRLNPFKVCLKTVVRQFCSICVRVGIFTKCTIILKNNKRVLLSKSAVTGQQNHFDSFFPFDPYLLRHSSRFFTDTYVHWKDVQMESDDENLEELTDDESDESDVEDGKPVGSSESDSEFSDFDNSSSDEDDNDESDGSEDEDQEVDRLTEEFMSFTPEISYMLSYHHKHRN